MEKRKQNIRILLITLLVILTQVFILTPVYALEEDKQQETVLMDEITSTITEEIIEEEN